MKDNTKHFIKKLDVFCMVLPNVMCFGYLSRHICILNSAKTTTNCSEKNVVRNLINLTKYYYNMQWKITLVQFIYWGPSSEIVLNYEKPSVEFLVLLICIVRVLLRHHHGCISSFSSIQNKALHVAWEIGWSITA